MHCARCQHENPDGARFCEDCGFSLAISCTKCATSLRAGSKFCHECGEPVAVVREREAQGTPPLLIVSDGSQPRRASGGISSYQSTLEHERQQVTILFADIKGSTELVADRDPDDARRILDPIIERMLEAVERYDGTLNRLAGDGIMALFGAPVAYEDHALRACYSALRMQETIRKYAETVRRTQGFLLQIRVGLNSGEVAARTLGGELPTKYAVDGQAVHLAARMEQLAIPGTILMASQTFRLTQGYLETKALGSMVVKGLTAPVETYELVGANTEASRLRVAAARGFTRFVGRGSEISQLRWARDQAQAGHGQVLAIVGEPGVGKSRLIHEFVRSQLKPDCRVFEIGAVSYGKTSYFPIAEFLRGYFQVATSDGPQAVREKVTGKLLRLDEALLPTLPALLMLLDIPEEETEVSTPPQLQRRRGTLEAVRRLLFRESESQPLVVVLEDLHNIDPETQALIDGLVDSLPATRILFVVSYRPEYRHRWSVRSYYSQIRVDALPAASARELLDGLVGTQPGLDPLKHMLIERTAGNPFFLEESVLSLVESGVLSGGPGDYNVTKPAADLKVPPTVESLLAARLDRLSPVDKRLLQAAAAIGNRVQLSVLQAIAELAPEQLRQALDRLQTAELVYETSLFPELEYTFRHALIHDVAYQSLSLDRRRALHIAALNAGERLYTDETLEKADWLAFHALRGQAWDRAVRYLRSAAARAVRRGASRIAVEHLENALVAAGHLSPEERPSVEVDLRIELRHALTPLGQVQRILEHLRAAEILADSMGDRLRLGRVVSFTANCLVNQARYAETLTAGARALGIAQELQDQAMEIATRIYMARARLGRGECREAIEIIGTLSGIPDDDFLGLPMLPATAVRTVLAAALAETGDFEGAAAHASEGAHRAALSRQPDSMVWGNWSCGRVALLRGLTEEALHFFESLRDLCRAHDLDAYTSRALAGVGCAKARLGFVRESLELLENAVALDAASTHTTTRSFALNALAEALFLASEKERALDIAKQALQFTREHEERGAEAHACFLLGLLHSMRVSEFEAAGAYLQSAASIAAQFGLRPLLAHCELGLAELHRKQGDAGKAREHLERGRGILGALGIRQWFRLDREAASGARPGFSG
jgi:class 3 adenylate cyclase/tetratricopeptide (TPR) repeat protein